MCMYSMLNLTIRACVYISKSFCCVYMSVKQNLCMRICPHILGDTGTNTQFIYSQTHTHTHTHTKYTSIYVQPGHFHPAGLHKERKLCIMLHLASQKGNVIWNWSGWSLLIQQTDTYCCLLSCNLYTNPT